jgi:N-acyl-D-amino-acid deacylase
MILIRSAQIIDGTGKPPFQADLFLRNDRISAIGNFSNKKADVIIDALGAYLAPGFIDVNTDSDHYLSLFTNPSQSSFLLQGVTTIIGGHCGSSLAPLLYGTLESIRKWTDINQINVNWHTAAEFLKILEKTNIGVNFGTLIGHSTIRRALIGNERRDLTEKEIKVFEKILSQSLEEGGFGLSTGLGYALSRQVPFSEIKALIRIVNKYHGVYATHLRNEKEGLLTSINETITLVKETSANTLIDHFRPIIGFERDYEKALDILEENFDKTNIHFNVYPFNSSIVPIHLLLPAWVQSGGLETMLLNLTSVDVRERIIKELPLFKYDDLIIARAPGIDYLAGKTIGEFAQNQNLSISEAMVNLMRITNLKAVVFHKNINLELVVNSLFRKNSLVASNSPGILTDPNAVNHERASMTFTKFLQIINRTQNISLETAVQKLTSIPAHKFNLKKRGVIKEGSIADLTIFNKDGGIKNVFINGKLAVKDGEFQNVLAGKVLRRA